MFVEYYDNNVGYEVLDNDNIVINTDNEELTCRAKNLLVLIGNQGFKTLLSNVMITISVVGYTEVESEGDEGKDEYFYFASPVFLSLVDWRNRGFDVEEVKRKWKFSFLYTDEEFMKLWERSKTVH